MKAIVLLFSSLGFTGAAVAAETAANLNDISGSVLANQGKAFIAAVPGQALAAGDRVMLMQGAGARMQFNDGCDVRLEGGTIITVPAVSTCAGGALDVSRLAGDAAAINAGTAVRDGWILFGAGAIAIGAALSDGTISP